MIVHAGCVARQVRGTWAAVLVTGASGSGKSDLILRLMERGWSLIGDDRVHLWESAGRLYAKAPDTLAGLIEARGIDVFPRRRRELAPVRLVVACVDPEFPLQRIPKRGVESLAGVAVEGIGLRALEASAPAKVELALCRRAGPFDSGPSKLI
jgi:serine kinase of HPr protein (carbohydrate metabolism regulator)